MIAEKGDLARECFGVLSVATKLVGHMSGILDKREMSIIMCRLFNNN